MDKGTSTAHGPAARRRRSRPRVLPTLAAGALAASAAAPTPASASTPTVNDFGTCVSLRLPVALAAGQSPDLAVAATLCVPYSSDDRGRVDVLVHGATYDQGYWDWPTSPDSYSYVAKTLSAGRATLAFDQLGSGASDHPAGSSVTAAAGEYVLHQMIRFLRMSGYSTVDVVAHSLGSMLAVGEAAQYHDADRLVLTGFLHQEFPPATQPTPPFYPASDDPRFANQGLDSGYLTTLPGTRGPQFYSASADPAVIAYDEAHKDTVPQYLLAAGLAAQSPPSQNPSSSVTVPVLVIDGNQDAQYCGETVDCTDAPRLQANETSYYSGAPSVTTAFVADTGHDLALHPSAGQSFTTIDAWLTR